MSSLYKNDLFIPSEEATKICSAGWHFLAAYGRLALLTYNDRDPKFSLVPKVHMLWHLVYAMDQDSRKGHLVLNPFCESCSVDEDVIGKFCLLTRHVSPRMRVVRSLQRYLTQVKIVWTR